jgi:hypothetical protein
LGASPRGIAPTIEKKGLKMKYAVLMISYSGTTPTFLGVYDTQAEAEDAADGFAAVTPSDDQPGYTYNVTEFTYTATRS